MDLLPLVAGALTAIPTAVFMTDSIQNSIVNKKIKNHDEAVGCYNYTIRQSHLDEHHVLSLCLVTSWLGLTHI